MTNIQIAIITSCISILIILVIGASLLYCCISEKRSRKHRLKGVNRIRHNSGNKYFRPKFQYTGDRHSMASWAAPKQNAERQRNSTSENQTSLNMQRPYMLPSVVQSPTSAWSSTHQTPFISSPPEHKGASAPILNSSNFYAYNAARPSNRSKNSYAKYQRKFKK